MNGKLNWLSSCIEFQDSHPCWMAKWQLKERSQINPEHGPLGMAAMYGIHHKNWWGGIPQE